MLLRDYQEDPRLDRYDSDLIDDESQEILSPTIRRQAELYMKRMDGEMDTDTDQTTGVYMPLGKEKRKFQSHYFLFNPLLTPFFYNNNNDQLMI